MKPTEIIKAYEDLVESTASSDAIEKVADEAFNGFRHGRGRWCFRGFGEKNTLNFEQYLGCGDSNYATLRVLDLDEFLENPTADKVISKE